ncbi:MAG: DRTGG domain-containing protein, partial [Desulfuromonadales bacterium]
MNREERVFVVGHRNPDTDSICSAMAYAELCRQQGKDNVYAARAGHLNRQTEYVLDTLQQAPPVLLTDVYPRLRDTISDQPVMIEGEAPLWQALARMRQRDIRMLPVIDKELKPHGALVLKRLTEHIFLPHDGQLIRQVLTSPNSIQSCLKATQVNMVEGEKTDNLELFVGAMSVASFQERLRGTNPQRIVVFVGDRRDIQECAIEMGIRLLVVTGGLTIDDELMKLAARQQVSVLYTRFDTATSALLARMSTPVHHLADKEIPLASPDDRLDEVRKVLVRSPSPGIMVLDRDGRVCGVATKSNLLQASSIKLILVDHNEL